MTAAPSLPRAPEWIPFEGPLDFLLEEVRRQNVALERIQMAPLVARYSEYIRTARDRNLDLDIEWLHTAAQLILWKSRSLLPRDPASPRPAADAIRDELVEELRRHRERMAKELGTRLAGEQARLARGSPESFAPERWAELQEPEDLPFVSAWDLLGQARDLARWCAQYRQDLRRWRETLDLEQEAATVEEMTAWLRERLELAPPGAPVEATGLLREQETSSRRACLFLGILELVRAGEIALSQPEAWGEIWVNTVEGGMPCGHGHE